VWWAKSQLKSRNQKWRLGGIEKLAKIEDERAVPSLLAALKDKESAIRVIAAKALGKFKEDSINEALIAALSDSHPEVRIAAAVSLRTNASEKAIPALQTALEDPNEGVRAYVAKTLDALKWSPKNDLEHILRAVALGKLEEAATYKALAVEPLLSVLRTGIYYKRLEALEALSKIADARIVAPLITALKDEDDCVRARVVEVLGRLGDARAVEPLIARLRDESSQVRAMAVEGLSRLGDNRALKPLILSLMDKSVDVRKAAAEALRKLKSAWAVEPLLKMLQDSDSDLREMVVSALGTIGDARAIQNLVLQLFDREEMVRNAAEIALAKIDAQWEHSEGAQSAIPMVEAALQDDDYWVRQIARALLKRLVGESAASGVAEEITTLADHAHHKRRDAAKILSAALKDFDQNLRFAAATALGQIGNNLGQMALVETLWDKDRWVRRAGAEALKAMQWEPTDDTQRDAYLIALQ